MDGFVDLIDPIVVKIHIGAVFFRKTAGDGVPVQIVQQAGDILPANGVVEDPAAAVIAVAAIERNGAVIFQTLQGRQTLQMGAVPSGGQKHQDPLLPELPDGLQRRGRYLIGFVRKQGAVDVKKDSLGGELQGGSPPDVCYIQYIKSWQRLQRQDRERTGILEDEYFRHRIENWKEL